MVNGGKPQRTLGGDVYGEATKTAAGPVRPAARASRPIAERPDPFPLRWQPCRRERKMLWTLERCLLGGAFFGFTADEARPPVQLVGFGLPSEPAQRIGRVFQTLRQQRMILRQPGFANLQGLLMER